MGQVLPHIDFNEYNWPCFTGTDWMSPREPLDTRPFQRLRKEASGRLCRRKGRGECGGRLWGGQRLSKSCARRGDCCPHGPLNSILLEADMI